jgi:hypothetical protein
MKPNEMTEEEQAELWVSSVEALVETSAEDWGSVDPGWLLQCAMQVWLELATKPVYGVTRPHSGTGVEMLNTTTLSKSCELAVLCATDGDKQLEPGHLLREFRLVCLGDALPNPFDQKPSDEVGAKATEPATDATAGEGGDASHG